ncbi:MAG TPA: DUF882 domain-containing protein [Methylothermaceae bacterium]|nr:DUF882 domain-containing protein [Methylothermaceae bacterium]
MDRNRYSKPDLSRRRFLTGLAATLVTVPVIRAEAVTRRPRTLAFLHMHTGESLRLEYHDGKRYLKDALREIDHFLRDFRTGEVHPIDPGVLDILFELQCRTTVECRPFRVFSGYRSPFTNALLRKRSSGVAKHSLHMQGKAIDINLPGVPVRHLYQVAWRLQRGGVGLYSQSGFIHVDTGRVRTWGA